MAKGGVRGGEEEWKRDMDGQKLSCVHNRRKQSSNPIPSNSRFEALPPFYTSDSTIPTFGTQRNIWPNVAMI